MGHRRYAIVTAAALTVASQPLFGQGPLQMASGDGEAYDDGATYGEAEAVIENATPGDGGELFGGDPSYGDEPVVY